MHFFACKNRAKKQEAPVEDDNLFFLSCGATICIGGPLADSILALGFFLLQDCLALIICFLYQ